MADFYLPCAQQLIHTISHYLWKKMMELMLVFDGTPIDPKIQSKLNYNHTFAFKEFKLFSDPMVYEFSDIDYPPSHNPVTRGAGKRIIFHYLNFQQNMILYLQC